jgi:adenine specific DNA methylase Mod
MADLLADATLWNTHACPGLLRGVTLVPDLATNVLYYGDNLAILRRYLPDAAVDLVYLDPPFKSNRDYNVIFRDESGNATDAQLLAFEDTWH